MHPATADLCVDQPEVVDEADAASHGADPVLAHGAECRRRQRGMPETRAVEITLDSEQEMVGLKVVASLNAAEKLGKAAVKIVAWNIQASAGPGATDVGADIKSR